ncbi:MAG: hypothetical protein HQK63_10925, partial [Desulfamplus sp.]|nr:hypothetical protein [Desulfamplus sp.]
MSKIGQIERATQNRVIKLFQNELGYRYLGNLEKEDNNSNLDDALLTAYLAKKGYTPQIINKALFEFKKAVTINLNDDLYQANKNVYSMLRYGIPVREQCPIFTGITKRLNWSFYDPSSLTGSYEEK